MSFFFDKTDSRKKKSKDAKVIDCEADNCRIGKQTFNKDEGPTNYITSLINSRHVHNGKSSNP